MSPPRAVIVVGVGVEAGTPPQHLRDAVAELGLAAADIAVVATVDTRGGEPAVLAVAAGRELRLYPVAALAAVEVPNPSAAVRRLTGTGSVAEAAALLAARERDADARLVVEKRRGPGVTVAAARVRGRDRCGGPWTSSRRDPPTGVAEPRWRS